MLKQIKLPRKRLYGSVQLSLAGQIEFADVDYCRILGRPLDDLIGRDFRVLIDERDRDAAAARFKSLVSSGATVQAAKRYLAAGGPPIATLTNVCLLRDPDGEPIAVVGTDQKLDVRGWGRLSTA